MEDCLLVPTFTVPGGFAAKATSGSITGTGRALRPIINSINAVTYSNHTDSHAPFYRSLMDAIRDFPAKIVALENALRLGRIN